TRSQIQTLMAGRKKGAVRAAPGPDASEATQRSASVSKHRRPVPARVSEVFLPVRGAREGAKVEYRPAILGSAKIHFTEKKSGIDQWETSTFLSPPPDDLSLEPWSRSQAILGKVLETSKEPLAPGEFAPLAGAMAR